MTVAVSSRRSGWRIALPALFVLVLAAGWTGAWFYAAKRAEGLIADWIAREARDGRSYACAERSVGGYPFRIEVRCTSPTAELTDRQGRITLKARELLAVAQVYQPDLVIAEITGPMSIAGLPADEAQYTADWKLLQASLRGRPRAPQRLSLAADKPTIQRAGAPLARAEHLELHVRRRESSEPGKPLFDLGARVTAGAIEGAAPWLSAPLDMEAAAILHGLDDFSAKPLAQRLREWQAADGRLEIAGIRLQQGEALAVAKGALSLDAEGRPSGSLNVTMAGFDRIVKAALGGEGGGRVQGLWAGLAMLSRAELEGRRAVALPLTFRDGRVLLGPIPIAQLHPLF